MYVWGVNSTVTKHSDYFVWMDTWEHVSHRCDDTVDKKRVHSCVLKYLFWREFSNQKNGPKNLEMLSPMRYSCHGFKISRLTPQKKKTQSAGFNEIVISEPKNLRNYFLHCICIHMFTYICMCAYVFIYVHLHVYIYTCI